MQAIKGPVLVTALRAIMQEILAKAIIKWSRAGKVMYLSEWERGEFEVDRRSQSRMWGCAVEWTGVEDEGTATAVCDALRRSLRVMRAKLARRVRDLPEGALLFVRNLEDFYRDGRESDASMFCVELRLQRVRRVA